MYATFAYNIVIVTACMTAASAKPKLCTVGQNVSMTLMHWQIGGMHNAPASAPAAAPASSTTASSVNGTTSSASYVYPIVVPNTPLYIGGVNTSTPAVQAQANYTVVDTFVRTIASGNADMSDLPADLALALAHRCGC